MTDPVWTKALVLESGKVGIVRSLLESALDGCQALWGTSHTLPRLRAVLLSISKRSLL